MNLYCIETSEIKKDKIIYNVDFVSHIDDNQIVFVNGECIEKDKITDDFWKKYSNLFYTDEFNKIWVNMSNIYMVTYLEDKMQWTYKTYRLEYPLKDESAAQKLIDMLNLYQISDTTYINPNHIIYILPKESEAFMRIGNTEFSISQTVLNEMLDNNSNIIAIYNKDQKLEQYINALAIDKINVIEDGYADILFMAKISVAVPSEYLDAILSENQYIHKYSEKGQYYNYRATYQYYTVETTETAKESIISDICGSIYKEDLLSWSTVSKDLPHLFEYYKTIESKETKYINIYSIDRATYIERNNSWKLYLGNSSVYVSDKTWEDIKTKF